MPSHDAHAADRPAAHPSDVKAAVEQRFSQVAANYRTSAVHATGAEFQHMLDLAGLRGDERVLDAGCGPGHTALTFAPHVARVTAVDLADAMLDQGRALAAQRRIGNVDFQRADVEKLPFDDAAFDLVVTRYSAHHWPNLPLALRQIRRVLRQNGGCFLLADVVSFNEPVIDTHLQAVELLRDPSHVRDHTTGQWLALLAEADFAAEVSYAWDLRLDFASWVARMATPPAAVAMIRQLLADAPTEVKAALRVERDSSFTLRCALLAAQVSDH